jgi:serine/threonine-protein phosphatase 2A activator
MINVIDKVELLCQETPPVNNAASRFGNPAFRTFYDKVHEVRQYPDITSLVLM